MGNNGVDLGARSTGSLSKVIHGQCMDFAATMVGLARSIGIPARMMTGLDSDGNTNSMNDIGIFNWNFHVWAELYINGEWHAFDANDIVISHIYDFPNNGFEPGKYHGEESIDPPVDYYRVSEQFTKMVPSIICEDPVNWNPASSGGNQQCTIANSRYSAGTNFPLPTASNPAILSFGDRDFYTFNAASMTTFRLVLLDSGLSATLYGSRCNYQTMDWASTGGGAAPPNWGNDFTDGCGSMSAPGSATRFDGCIYDPTADSSYDATKLCRTYFAGAGSSFSISPSGSTPIHLMVASLSLKSGTTGGNSVAYYIEVV